MRAARILARGFRNLADLDLPLPPDGAVFLGPNGHGKTNLLEALSYPVLFRSFRGSRDSELTCHGAPGFQLTLTLEEPALPRELSAGFQMSGKRKRLTLDGTPPERGSAAIGQWLAVGFLPTDLRLVQGPGAARRQYLDRVLALADRNYLRALLRYRSALAQRNSALRQRRPDLAAAFDDALATAGAWVVRRRLEWASFGMARFADECLGLGEPAPMALRYEGDAALADAHAWPEALGRSAKRDEARGLTCVGPHRHDLAMTLGGRPLREVGSTGQHRTAAVALKLCERDTLARASGTEPALLLDDVFAELDRSRQERLAERLQAGRAQSFITAPRDDELPRGFRLETFSVCEGRVEAPAGWLAA